MEGGLPLDKGILYFSDLQKCQKSVLQIFGCNIGNQNRARCVFRRKLRKTFAGRYPVSNQCWATEDKTKI